MENYAPFLKVIFLWNVNEPGRGHEWKLTIRSMAGYVMFTLRSQNIRRSASASRMKTKSNESDYKIFNYEGRA